MRKTLLFASIVIALALQVAAQNKPSSSEIPACNTPERKSAIQHARLFLNLQSHTLSLKDELIMDVGIRNEGDTPIYIYSRVDWGFGGGFVLEVTDQAGKYVGPGFRDDTVLPPPRKFDDPGLFVALDTNYFFGVHRALPLRPTLKLPGKYNVRVKYNNPASCVLFDSKIQALPILWHHDPDLISNRVSFEVTP